MSDFFQDKVAVVTGASSGIGRATATAFAREGCRVVLANRRVEAGETTAQTIKEAGGDAVFMRTDVTKPQDVQGLMDTAFEKYGRLDFTFNNAGAQPTPAPTADQTEDDWNRMIDVNLKGTWLCMKYAIPHMLANGGGAIVNNASVSGLAGIPNWPAQCASKHGVVGLTRAAALEHARSGIRVNVVCPGAIDTPMADGMIGGSEEVRAAFAAMEPMGRFGRPEEIAAAVLWLCSEAASFVTGHTLAVDGGWMAQ